MAMTWVIMSTTPPPPTRFYSDAGQRESGVVRFYVTHFVGGAGVRQGAAADRSHGVRPLGEWFPGSETLCLYVALRCNQNV